MFIVVGIILFCIFLYLMYRHYQLKKKIYEVRCQMQQDGLIPENSNLKLIYHMSLYFWFIPVNDFKKLGNKEHNDLLKNCNQLNYIMIALFFAIPISMSLLSGI